MACFIVSAVEAAAVTAVEKVEEKKEARAIENGEEIKEKVPFSRKLKWLSYMLWGGAFLLMFEHVWHGEVVAWFPFLTAMSDKADMIGMFKEMATVGVCMALLITAVWAVMCVVADMIIKRPAKSSAK